MADLATLQGWQAALQDAKASGVQTVEHQGDRITYRSMAEIDQALAWLERQIAGATGQPARRLVRMSTSKGVLEGGGVLA